MKRLALAAALVLMTVFPASASASVTQFSSGSCTQIWNNSGNPVPFVCLTEDDQYGGDKLILTGSSDVANLDDIGHTLGGYCAPHYIGPDTWNDCITSVWAKLGTDDSFCLHSAAGYSNQLIWWAAAPSSPAGGVWTYATPLLSPNDSTSSVRLQQSGTDCPDLPSV